LALPVQIVLEDPGGKRDSSTQLRFFIGKTEIETVDGRIPISSLDSVSVTTFAQLASENAAAARGLVNIRMLEEKVRFAGTEIPPLAGQIAEAPEKFAYNDVKALHNSVNELFEKLNQSQANLHPFNADFTGNLMELVTAASEIKATVDDAFGIARNFFGTHQPDYTAGEMYDMAEEEAWHKSEFSPSGSLEFANLVATKFWHFAGNALTAGHTDLQAANASMYRKGMISWKAFKENEWWNMGRSAIIAVVSGLSAGWASRAASGLFSLEAGSAASNFVSGSAGGGAFGLSGAMTSDAYAKIVAELTSDPDVAGYHEATIGGPEAWIKGLAYGAMAGGFFSWLSSLFSRRGTGVLPEELGELEETAGGEISELEEAAAGGLAAGDKAVVYINGKPFEPTSYGRVFHGTELPPEIVVREGLPEKGSNWDLLNHVKQGPDSALRGATTEVFTPDRSAGAGKWGEWVYEIRGMPSWDTNALLEGRVKTPGEFKGNPMYGELEQAIPARVPAENIVRVAHIVEVAGRIKVEWMLPAEALAKRSP
ncbi:MAG: hypothetical protein WAM60_24490, partial [Candidatus Promineifilaceae bacterium]